MTVARFLLFAFLIGLGGVSLLTRLSREPRSGPGLLGLGFVIGVLGTAIWTHLLLVILVPVNLWTVSVAPLAFVAACRWESLREASWRRPPPLAWIVAGAAVFILWGAISFSLPGYDPGVFYVLKAKSILEHGTFWNEDFTDTARIHPAHHRPLLLPCIYVDLFLAAGSVDTRLLRIWFALIQLAAFGGMYDVLRGRMGRNEAAAALALYSWCPVLWHDAGGVVSAYADAPLSMIVLFALASGGRIAVLMAVAGALLKDEGIAFILPFALARGVRLAVIPAAVSVLWIAIASRLPRDVDFLPRHFLDPHISSVPIILRQLAGEFASIKHWGLLWLTILAVLAWRARRLSREDVRWLGPIGLQLLIYCGVWSTLPVEALRSLIRVEDMRLMLHLLPAAWVWAVWRTVGTGAPAPNLRGPAPSPSS